MITTAIVKKSGLYITDLNDISSLKSKKVKVDITILEQPRAGTKKKKKFNPSSFRGLLSLKNIKKEIKSIRAEWDRL